MTQYLIGRIYGPMAAWGDIAVGEFRPHNAHPSRTAIFGLIAAALGYRRADEARHIAMHQALKLAVRLDARGTVLRDYHTTQVPPQQRKVYYQTRREELQASKLNTILSTRDYRCDSLVTIAIQSTESDYSLTEIAAALREPKLPLYLGRKSCPLAWPIHPQIIEANDLVEAYAQYKPIPAELAEELDNLADLINAEEYMLYWEKGIDTQTQPDMSYPRQDRLLSRKRWQYAPRTEYAAQIKGA